MKMDSRLTRFERIPSSHNAQADEYGLNNGSADSRANNAAIKESVLPNFFWQLKPTS